MNTTTTTLVATAIVGDDDETLQLTTAELCRVCRTSETEIQAWVVEGVLAPSGDGDSGGDGDGRDAWRFGAAAVRRLRVANRLVRDLELNAAGVAVALDLLDRVAALERRLQALGGR